MAITAAKGLIKMGPINPQEPDNVLDRIKRGLAGYVSYLAACEMNDAFSEYVLYEPILRILMARGFLVECEAECPGVVQPNRGDKKRLDFDVNGHGLQFAIEVKWAKVPGEHNQGARDRNLPPWRLDVASDHEKLLGYLNHHADARSFLCVFGRESHITTLALDPNNFEERGRVRIAGFETTMFGCRMYELWRPALAPAVVV
jgi:hypothetical protein